MYQWINGISVVWFVIGLLGLGGSVLVMLTEDGFTVGLAGLFAGLSALTACIVLMGFAQIVEYFEKANGKRKHGNQQR